MLEFGQTISIIIDGTQLPIRFGAPGRELYIGKHPFRGAFGGPPIFATINGIRHEVRCFLYVPHENLHPVQIRIGAPPPEVKIEPEPSYELARFLATGGTQHALNYQGVTRPDRSLLPQPSVQPMTSALGALAHRIGTFYDWSSVAMPVMPLPPMAPMVPPATMASVQPAAPPNIDSILASLRSSGEPAYFENIREKQLAYRRSHRSKATTATEKRRAATVASANTRKIAACHTVGAQFR